MLRKNFSYFFIFNLIGFISSIRVEIDIQPETIQPGDDLRITCNVITEDPYDKRFKTQLRCPFYNGDEVICIANCDSEDSCTENSCDRKAVLGQHFQCNLEETVTSLSYSYLFKSLSNTVIKDRKQLPFKCAFKGNFATGSVNISNKIKDKIPSQKREDYRPILTNSPEIIKKTDSNLETGSLKPYDLILVGLLLALFVSIGINCWCSIKRCISCFKSRYDSHFHLNQMYQNPHKVSENNNWDNKIIPPYDSFDHIKRAKSQPTLSDPDKNVPPRYISNNRNQFNSGSINFKPKFKGSLQTFDEYELNNGSEHSVLNPLYGQMVLAPIQCLDPSMFPHLTPLSKSYSQQIHINTDIDQGPNNLDIFVEEEISNKRHTSISHLLPEKPS